MILSMFVCDYLFFEDMIFANFRFVNENCPTRETGSFLYWVLPRQPITENLTGWQCFGQIYLFVRHLSVADGGKANGN
jgi:hypothetical protein